MAELLADARIGYRALVQGDIHRLPLKDRSVAAMILSNTLHHVPDRTLALEELHRVLAPGGVVICYDPRRVAPLEAVKRLARRSDDAFTDHHCSFAPAEYRTMLEDAGLEIERYIAVDPIGPLLATALDMVRAGTFVDRDRIASVLVAVDRTIERRDRRGGIGLMLLARARMRD
jgi:SAM-dependent methyltransferase